MQPTYIPWIGYFDMIDMVDVFVLYNDVQLTRRSWQVRNRLRNKFGEFWLTLPVKKTVSRNELLIKDAVLDNNEKWKKKHLKTIKAYYSKTPYFNQLFELIESKYTNAEKVSDFNIDIIKSLCEKMNIKTNLIRSSDIEGISGTKDLRLVNICKKLGIQKYLSAQGSSDYINENIIGGEFFKNDIKLYYHSYNHLEYNQLYSDFIPNLGVFDLIFNHGFEKSIKIIRKGRQKNKI